VKVTFLVLEAATLLRPCAYADGTFGLVSTGAAFGRSGFYRIVELGTNTGGAEFQDSHEIFHVYADEDGVLRTVTRLHSWAYDPAVALQDDAGTESGYSGTTGSTVFVAAGFKSTENSLRPET